MGVLLFAVGAALGLIGAYTLDPREGAKRRAELAKSFQKGIHSAQKTVSQQAEHISEVANEALHRTEEKAEDNLEIVFEPSSTMDLGAADSSSTRRTSGGS
jgi:hypothetical protein